MWLPLNSWNTLRMHEIYEKKQHRTILIQMFVSIFGNSFVSVQWQCSNNGGYLIYWRHTNARWSVSVWRIQNFSFQENKKKKKKFECRENRKRALKIKGISLVLIRKIGCSMFGFKVSERRSQWVVSSFKLPYEIEHELIYKIFGSITWKILTITIINFCSLFSASKHLQLTSGS